MADILADYREWRQQQAGRVSTHSDGCHMWHKDCMIHRLAAALAVEQAKRTPERPSTPGEGTRQVACTLTDEEREAIEYAAVVGRVASELDREVLKGLLKRNGSPDGCETVQQEPVRTR
jgi:hypothetical protein